MIDTADIPAHDDPDALAAEYVLGVMPLVERIAFEVRLKRDPALAALVSVWEVHFSGLNDAYGDVPAPDLMARIEARMFGTPVRRQWFWPRFLLGLATAAALTVAAVVFLPPSQGPGLTATLSGEAQALVFAARYDDGTLRLTRTAGPDAAVDRSYELWLILGEAAPLSLGVIEAAEITRQLPDLPAGAVLAVTLEPAGGSPAGVATGPLLVSGVIGTL